MNDNKIRSMSHLRKQFEDISGLRPEDFEEEWLQFKALIKAQRLDLLEKLEKRTPKQKDTWVNKDTATEEQIRMKSKEWGFNDCRDKVLKIIKELKHEA